MSADRTVQIPVPERLSALRDLLAGLPDYLFEMDDWYITPADGGGYGLVDFHVVDDCGTAACAAGWTVARLITDDERLAMVQRGRGWLSPSEVAGWLGIEERDLFYTSMWPEQFQAMAVESGERVAAIALIDHLVATRPDEPGI